MTGRVRTVLGDVEPGELGVTFAHEHLLMTGGWPVMQEPDYRLDSVEAAVAEVDAAKAAGLGALVEMTPNGFGRSARGLQEISRRTGVHVVATTGLHKVGYYADNHWLHLAFDRPGRTKYAPDSDTVALLARLAEDGHADRLLLASDLARRSYWTSLGGGPGLPYLLETFRKRVAGTELAAVVDRALTVNAARVLTLAAPS